MSSELAVARQGLRAGFVSRLLANVIDGAVIVAFGGLLVLAAAIMRYFVDTSRFEIPSIPGWLEAIVALLLVLSYLTYGWSGSERTVGQYLMGLRITTAGGVNLSTRRALVRAAACIIFPLGLAWSLVSRRDASLQDLLLRTVVVYDLSYRHPAGAAGRPGHP